MATATPGIIAWSNVPNPAPQGLQQAILAALVAAGFAGFCTYSPNGIEVADVATAESVVASFSGSPTELAWWQKQWQADLDAWMNANFDLLSFIRAGHNSAVTATGIGTFLATITNNYRSLRAQIAAASTVAAVQAINIQSGWPSNP
jgi:hypothetical protein